MWRLAMQLLRMSLILLVMATGLVGCTRALYRQRADADANCLIDQKAGPVCAEPGTLRIDLDPRSRMFSPESPDCPAMPPDDPTAHRLLCCVDCKKGSKCNCHAKRTPFVENPNWLAYLPRDEQDRVVLDLPAAVQLGLLHSPDYQSQLEELYLSALDVSFERFRFDAQFFGGSSVFFTADGRNRSATNGVGNSSSLLEVNTSRPGNRYRIEKFTATGGEIVAGFANSLVWQFAGPNDYTSTTILDFALIQPLLRTGGRTRVLERLTISERALLANVRAMERYRRGFYLNLATGRFPGQGPSRRGGFFGGSGLEGFSGVGGGGFGRVGGGFGGQGGGGGFAGGAGAAAAGGYLGLLQQQQQIDNQRANVIALNESVEQLQDSYDAGRIDRFQVDLARQALFNAQSQLLRAEADFRSIEDEYKITLGLPPSLQLRLVDPMLDPFQLRSQELTDLQYRVAQENTDEPDQDSDEPELLPLEEVEEAENGGPEILALGIPEASESDADVSDSDEPVATLNAVTEPTEGSQGLSEIVAATDSNQPRETDYAAEVRQQIEAVREDYRLLLEVLPDRKKHLQQLAGREEVAETRIDAKLLSPERLEQRVKQLGDDLDQLASRIEAALDGDSARSDPEADVEADLPALLLELSLLQARARLDAIDIEPTELTDYQALEIARVYRRDWKNARIALVDAWRLINFNANDLLSDLDIVFSGDIGNVGDNPFRLSDTNGRLRVGIEFDAPLTRLAERNIYRQALIEFDQARRNYYRFVDRVSQGLRQTLRQIRLNEINFELRREAVLVAIAQVDLTQFRLSEPPRPGTEDSTAQQLGNTTARDLVQSLSDLLNVQNDFLSVWVNNHVQRLNLEFDLGVMQLDPMGHRLPLGMPLADYLYAEICCIDGGPERSGSDIEELDYRQMLLPAECQPLQFSPDMTTSAQPLREIRPEAYLLPASFEQDLPNRESSTRPVRLPPVGKKGE